MSQNIQLSRHKSMCFIAFIVGIFINGFTYAQKNPVVTADRFTHQWAGETVLLHYAPDETEEKIRTALDKVVSIDLQHVSLEEALNYISGLAGLKLAYSTSVAEAYWQKVVSVSFDRATVLGAYYAVLDGTGLELTLSSNSERGHLVVEKKGTQALDEMIAAADGLFQRTITGYVIDAATGEALPGVNVIVEGSAEQIGSTIGATTNAEGFFEIHMPEGFDTIAFSYIGYQRLLVDIEDETPDEITVELVADV